MPLVCASKILDEYETYAEINAITLYMDIIGPFVLPYFPNLIALYIKTNDNIYYPSDPREHHIYVQNSIKSITILEDFFAPNEMPSINSCVPPNYSEIIINKDNTGIDVINVWEGLRLVKGIHTALVIPENITTLETVACKSLSLSGHEIKSISCVSTCCLNHYIDKYPIKDIPAKTLVIRGINVREDAPILPHIKHLIIHGIQVVHRRNAHETEDYFSYSHTSWFAFEFGNVMASILEKMPNLENIIMYDCIVESKTFSEIQKKVDVQIIENNIMVNGLFLKHFILRH